MPEAQASLSLFPASALEMAANASLAVMSGPLSPAVQAGFADSAAAGPPRLVNISNSSGDGGGSFLEGKVGPDPSSLKGTPSRDIYADFMTVDGFVQSMQALFYPECIFTGKVMEANTWCNRAYPILDVLVVFLLLSACGCLCCYQK